MDCHRQNDFIPLVKSHIWELFGSIFAFTGCPKNVLDNVFLLNNIAQVVLSSLHFVGLPFYMKMIIKLPNSKTAWEITVSEVGRFNPISTVSFSY